MHAPPPLFISYSRAQLAVAESLALTASEAGLTVWFDLLGLTPGSDWQASIDSGIDAAAGCALLVSAESCRSINVAREVTRGLARGKPLYLLVVDDTPLQLRHAPYVDLSASAFATIDFRGDFHSACGRLVESLRSGTPVHDAIVPRRFWETPRFTPRSVIELAFAFAMPIVAMLAIGLGDTAAALQSRIGRMTIATMIGTAVWLFYSLRRLLCRQLDAEALLLVLVAGNVAAWTGLWQISRAGYPLLPSALTAAALAASLWAVWRVITNDDLSRWIPQLEFVAFNINRRAQFNRLVERSALRPGDDAAPIDYRPYFYRLHGAADDRAIADLVRVPLDKIASALPGGVLPPPTTIDFLLLSNRTTRDEVERFLDLPATSRVVVMASAVRLADDLAARLARLQYLELRDQQPYQLGNFVMAVKGVPQARLLFASNLRPHGFGALTAPNGVKQMTTAARNLAALWLLSGGLTLVGLAPRLHVAGFALALWQFATVHWLYRRTLPLGLFGAQWAANMAVAAALGLPQLVVTRTLATIAAPGGPVYWIVFLLVVLFPVATGVFELWVARRWFAAGWGRPAALGGPSHAALLRGHVPYLLLAIASLFYVVFANE